MYPLRHAMRFLSRSLLLLSRSLLLLSRSLLLLYDPFPNVIPCRVRAPVE